MNPNERRTPRSSSAEPGAQSGPADRTVRVLSLIHSASATKRADAPSPVAAPAPVPAAAGAEKSPWLQKLNKVVVDTYKVIGFAILTIIVFALVSYLGTTLFYVVSKSWSVPTVISPTDDRVVQLQTRLTEQQAQRDKLAADMRDADRVIASQEEFQAAFRNALAADLKDRQTELSRLRSLSRHYSATRSQIERSNKDFSGYSRDRMEQEFSAHLIDRDALLSGSYQLAQIAHANLSLAEKEAELGTRTSEVSREAQSLESALRRGDQQLSYEVLKMTEDYRRSVLETEKARDDRAVLAQTIARYDQMIALLQASPYVRAAAKKATLAFAPYENLDGITAGTPVYGCSFAMLACHRVGSVVSVVPGEVIGRHPQQNEELRGRMLEIQLTDARWGEARVLFTRGAPLWL